MQRCTPRLRGKDEKAELTSLVRSSQSAYGKRAFQLLEEDIAEFVYRGLAEEMLMSEDLMPKIRDALLVPIRKAISEENYGLDRATVQKINPSWGSSIIVPVVSRHDDCC